MGATKRKELLQSAGSLNPGDQGQVPATKVVLGRIFISFQPRLNSIKEIEPPILQVVKEN